MPPRSGDIDEAILHSGQAPRVDLAATRPRTASTLTGDLVNRLLNRVGDNPKLVIAAGVEQDI